MIAAVATNPLSLDLDETMNTGLLILEHAGPEAAWEHLESEHAFLTARYGEGWHELLGAARLGRPHLPRDRTLHLRVVAMTLGGTAAHLRDWRGIEPASSLVHVNLRQHVLLHDGEVLSNAGVRWM